MIKLSDFRKEVSDFARPNRFKVLITPPSDYEFNDNEFKLLSWIAETAQIPSRAMGEVSIKYHGMELKLPGDYTKENITIGFLNSYGWEGRNFFEMWMEFNQQVSEQNIRQSANTMLNGSKIVINQLGRIGNIIASYELYNVFPINLSSIDLSSSEYDSIEKFTVEFSYSHWVQMEVTNG